jgi:hypothetical protein
LRALDEASGGVVRIDPRGWSSEKRDDMLAKLRTEYRAAPDLLEAMDRQGGMSRLSLHRFGGSSLYLSQTIQGTAYCQRFVFFEAPADAPGHVIDPPPIAATGDDTAFCWRTAGYAGEIAGVPAFIVESDRDNAVELSITPRRDGQWEKACGVVVTFDDDFVANERFCQAGVDCNAMAERARWLAEELDKKFDPRTATADTSTLAVDAPLDDQLPTFGDKVKDPYRFSYTQFYSDTIFLPVAVGGQIYVGRIGHAGFAWRRSPDYLFAAYKMTGDKLEPIAGIYVVKTRARPKDVKVD